MFVADSQSLNAAFSNWKKTAIRNATEIVSVFEAAWYELLRTLNALLATLPVKSPIREEAVSNHQLEEQTSADHLKV